MPTITVYEITQLPQGPGLTQPLVRQPFLRSDEAETWLAYFQQREPLHVFEIRTFEVLEA